MSTSPAGRTPSWGAWIEMKILIGKLEKSSRTPSWGAWIEMANEWTTIIGIKSHPLVGCVD